MSEPGRPKCPVCGRLFWCDYPNKWVYKRGTVFLCSWGCLRKYDKGKEAKDMILLTEAQKKKAISIAKTGESPYKYLKELGVANPTTSWKSILNWARNKLDRNELEELPESFGQPKKANGVDVPPQKPGTPKPPEEPEKEWTPAEEVYPKEEPKVELVYDESIAEEYRREQEAKKAAEDPLVHEIPIRKERVNIGPARLPIASVWSRAMEMGTFTKVQGIGMMLKDPECQILMSRAKWEELADEIRVALEMLEV